MTMLFVSYLHFHTCCPTWFAPGSISVSLINVIVDNFCSILGNKCLYAFICMFVDLIMWNCKVLAKHLFTCVVF